jgi:hypothetical protein
MDLLEKMLGELLDVVVMVYGLIVEGDSDYFIVILTLVFHAHHAYHFGINET